MAEGRSIPCPHKVVLAAASDFFQRKLISEVDDSADAIHNLLEIENIEFTTIKQVVGYIYTGNLDTYVSLEAARKLVIASSLLLLHHLRRKCEEVLLTSVDTSSCVDYYKFGKRYGLNCIKDKAQRLMHENFHEVVSGSGFLEMRMDEIIEYASSEDLAVTNENPVYQAVVRWVMHDVKARRDHFPSLLKYVRLSFCSPEFLRDVVAVDSLMENLPCKNLLMDAFIKQSRTSSSHSALAEAIPKPRRGYGKTCTLIMIGNIGDYVHQTDRWWVLKDDNWEEMTHSRRPLCSGDIGACLLEDGILITGGDGDEGPASKECWLLSTQTLEWSRLPDMKNNRCSHGSVYCEGHAYVLGGTWESGDQAIQPSVERLEKDRSRWTSMPAIPEGRSDAAAVGYGSLIYIFGGNRPKGVWKGSNTNFEFNTLSQTWSERAPMPIEKN